MSSAPPDTPAHRAAEPTSVPGALRAGPGGAIPGLADWLAGHPEFLEQHPDLLAGLQLSHVLPERVASLLERQVLVLRRRHDALEARLHRLFEVGRANDRMARQMLRFTCHLLDETDPSAMPARIEEGLRSTFALPAVCLRIWGRPVAAPWGTPVAPEVLHRCDVLPVPYCGPCARQPELACLPQGGAGLASMATLPLRHEGVVFGMLLLATPDPERFDAGMATGFLERLSEVASAALWPRLTA